MGSKNNKEIKKPEINIYVYKKEKIIDQCQFNQRALCEQKSLPIIYQYKIQSQIPQQQNDIFQENEIQFLNCDPDYQECGNLNQSTFNLQPALKDYGMNLLNDCQIQSSDDKKLIDLHELKNKLRIMPLIIQDEQNPIVIQIQEDLKIEFNYDYPTEQEAILYKDKQIQIKNLRIAGIWKYLGYCEANLKNKQSFQLFDKSLYIGDWFKKKRQGYGLLINEDYLYEGYWNDDKYHGNGIIIYGNSNVYIGQFKQGLYSGEGLYIKYNIDQSNIIYEGEWLLGLKNGMGKEQMSDGSIFIGQFKNNERHGQGKLFNIRDQYVFEGQWIEGISSERGILIWQDGKRFEGGWQNNMMSGQGIFIWPGGKKYIGNYVNNLRDGYGEYYYQDGKVYKGMWKEGLMNGQGIIIYPNNTHEKGIWIQGKRINLQGKQKHKKMQFQQL